MDRHDYLSPKALTILAMLLDARARGDPMPSHREMSRAIGNCPNNPSGIANWYLPLLERAGLIGREKKSARTVRATCEFIPAESR
jgi:hypothetical protein